MTTENPAATHNDSDWRTLSKTLEKQIIQAGQGLSLPTLRTSCVMSMNVYDCHHEDNRSSKEDVEASLKSLGFSLVPQKKVQLGSAESLCERLLESCLMTMKPGEESRFSVSLSEFPSCSRENTRTPCDSIHFGITLHDMDSVTPPWDLPDEELFNVGLSHKEKGNALFTSGNVEAAFYQYSVAVKHLLVVPISDSDPAKEDDDLIDKWDKLKCACHLNLAACQAQFSHQDGVISNCSSALKIQPDNVKGLFRRAQAYLANGEASLARQDLVKARKLEPRSKAVADLLTECQSGT